MRERLQDAVALGAAAGALEFLFRTQARLGFGFFEQATWLTLAVVAGILVALPAALVARALQPLPHVGARHRGLVLGALIGLHGALYYRFELVLNESLRDPQVWGGMLALGFAGVLVGLGADRLLRKVARFMPVVAVLGGMFGLMRGLPAPNRGDEGMNVLLVTWDTTRPDRLGPYGGPASTPALDRLAAQGIVFDQAVASAPLTEPSHLSILTGQHTFEHGVVSNATPLGERPELISRQLQEAGFVTGAVVSGFPLHAKWGWDQGFDIYDDDFSRLPGLHRLSLVVALDQLFLPGNTLRERPGVYAERRALQFLRRRHEGRFFLWVHLFDPHGPYEMVSIEAAPRDGEALDLPAYWPPPHRSITDEAWLIEAYDAELSEADRITGALMDELEELGVADETVIILTADHGESLTEHDYLFDHGDHLYDPSLRVPLIWSIPGYEPGRVPCQVGNASITPTLRALFDLPGSDRSLLERLSGAAPCADEAVVSSTVGARFVETPPVDWSYRLPHEKYIQHGDAQLEPELYDLVQDAAETRSVDDDDALARAAQNLDALLGGGDVLDEIEAPAYDESALEALRSLGYVE
jgi:choline-sulfatase